MHGMLVFDPPEKGMCQKNVTLSTFLRLKNIQHNEDNSAEFFL